MLLPQPQALMLHPGLPLLWDDAGTAVPVASHLGGHQGKNRAPGANALGVNDDLSALRMFLHEYAGSPATLRTYAKEVERLVLWCHVERGCALSDLDRGDFAAYSAFLSDPTPQARWCGPRRGRVGMRQTAGWRPFVGPLSPSAHRTALIILNTMMGYLVKAGYLQVNPLALMRRQSSQQLVTVDQATLVRQRVLDNDQWQAVMQTVQAPHAEDFADPSEALRARFLVALMYFLALRVGELVTHTMGHFRQVHGRWVFYVVGKGQKAAEVPVNDVLLAEVISYRQSLGLQPYPLPSETLPLITHRDGRKALGARRINQLVKQLMERAALRLPQHLAHRAEHMRQASAHWFRHTSLTRQAQAGLHFTHIKANARHARLDTTMIYIHTEEAERHKAMQNHRWDNPNDEALAPSPTPPNGGR